MNSSQTWAMCTVMTKASVKATPTAGAKAAGQTAEVVSNTQEIADQRFR
jgi:hypothetical protein